MKWFTGIHTAEQAKQRYHELVKMYHPDNGGSGNEIKEIQCDFFDVVSLYFNDDPKQVQYDFYVDDLGYYKNYEPVVLSANYSAILGTTVIKRHDEQGEDVSLEIDDVVKIVSHIAVYNPDPEDLTKYYFCLRGTMR